MKILDWLAINIQLGKMWRRQSTIEMLKRKENFKRSGIKTTSPKNRRVLYSFKKNCIHNIMIMTGISQ